MGVHELSFRHKGRTFHCKVDSEGEAAGGMSRPSNAVWLVQVDGADHAPFDASPDDTADEVQRRVTAWFDAEPPSRKKDE